MKKDFTMFFFNGLLNDMPSIAIQKIVFSSESNNTPSDLVEAHIKLLSDSDPTNLREIIEHSLDDVKGGQVFYKPDPDKGIRDDVYKAVCDQIDYWMDVPYNNKPIVMIGEEYHGVILWVQPPQCIGEFIVDFLNNQTYSKNWMWFEELVDKHGIHDYLFSVIK